MVVTLHGEGTPWQLRLLSLPELVLLLLLFLHCPALSGSDLQSSPRANQQSPT